MEGHQGGVWYYPIAMLVGLFPWSLWLAPFSVWLWKLNPLGLWISAPQTNKEDSELGPKKLRINSLARLSLIWVAVYVGAFSCANTKLPSYITPCYPGAALTLGLFFACLANNPGQLSFQQRWNAWRSRAMRYATLATLITSLLTGIGASLALAMIAYQEKMYQVVWQSLWGIALSCAAIAALDAWRKNMVQRIPICFAAGSLICMSGWMVGGAATASRYRLDLNALQQIQSDHPEQRWLAVGILEPSWIFYTQHSIPEIPIASSQSPASGTLAQSASGHSLPWTQQVVDRWEQNPNLGIITLDCWANELKQYLNEHSESRLKSYQMVRQDYPYFLRHQPLCLLSLQRADISPDATAEKSPPASTDFRR
jgi:4-amino-4-deoxy-L-arabinose transferase-like glycosyltransferase